MILNTIRNKISLTYILSALLILTVIAIVIDLEMEARVKKEIESNLLHHIAFLTSFVENAPERTGEELSRILHQHEGATRIRVTLIDSVGKVLLDSSIPWDSLSFIENHLRRPEIQLAAVYGYGKNIRLSRTTKQEYFYVAKKVHLRKHPVFPALRYVRASILLDQLERQIASVRGNVLTAGAIVLLLVLVLSLFISKKITKPLRQIIGKVNEISQGNYDRTVSVNSHDEMRMLSDSINRLTAKINHDLVELDRLAKVRSQFLANVSHEFRTPLFSMQAFLETLLKGAINDPEVNRKYLAKTLTNIDRLNFLLNDLIDISRIESGELKLSFRFFAIQDLFQTIRENYREACERKQIAFSIEDANGLQVYGDKSRLQQVFSNLIDNAIKYNPPGTSIRLYHIIENRQVFFYVEDTGIGIAEEHLPRLFERFYRIDKERSRETGGTGLGLAIVKHIIEAHHSSIDVTSAPGKGTTFSFSLRTGD
jgi:two-component system phosphate regulon sensor histidine kinase PhoR